jgi:hypothetical protein
MATVGIRHLVFGVMAIANEPLEMDIRTLVQRWIMNMSAYYVWDLICKSNIANMVTANILKLYLVQLGAGIPYSV